MKTLSPTRSALTRLALGLAAAATATAGLLAPTGATATNAEWNDGFHDEDQIISCYTYQVTTGVGANVGWMSPTGQVTKVGEVFWLRGYAGLVGQPCSGKVNIIPEIMVPAGVEFAEGDVRWDISKPGEQVLTTDPIAIDHGNNGGILIGNADETPFVLRQGEVLEFQFPVVATRELKGPATQQPMCQSRLDGDAPCPIDKSGDHFQVGFLTSGHGGDRWYVTPFVGLFASSTTTTPTSPTPTTPAPTTPTSPGSPLPTTPTSPGAPLPTTPTSPTAPGGSVVSKAPSTTKATWKASATRRGKVTVVVSSSRAATGAVVVKDKGRTIARGVLKADHRGRIVITLPKLRRGKHALAAHYTGSATVAASTSARRAVSLR